MGNKTKNIHVKLDRETHLNFRSVLLHHNVSMQDAFDAFAQSVAASVPTSLKIVDSVVRNKIKAELAAVGLKPMKGPKRKPEAISELDAGVIYDLINEGDEDDESALSTPL